MKNGPLKRHGGKSYLAPKIRALFPPHTRYCEPFFGGGAVLLAGDGEGVAEYANDIDAQLINFWWVLSDEEGFERFSRFIEAIPFGEPCFDFAQEYLGRGADPKTSREKHAAGFFVVNRQSRQALGKDFATPTSRLRRGMNEQVSAWLSAVDGLPEFHARLRRVEIRCMKAVDFIRELDSPDTLFYCDPPYMHETRTVTDAYQHEMTPEQHEALLECLASLEGKFVLSGYPSKLYQDFADRHNWRQVDFSIDNKSSGAKSKEKKIERCWMNYKQEAASE